MRRADRTLLDGVASYGRRPTFDNGPPLLEVFAFDFSGDLYGEQVIVVFHDWIRAEAKFPSVDALVAAMQQDVAAAGAILAGDRAGKRARCGGAEANLTAKPLWQEAISVRDFAGSAGILPVLERK